MKQQAQMYECRECSVIPDANAIDLHRCQHCGARGSIVPVEASPAVAPPAPPVDPNTAVIRMNPWRVERDARIIRRVGKLGEECAELMKVIFRINIQGLHGIDPASGKSNLQCLQEEVADVNVQCDLTIEHFKMNCGEIVERMDRKRSHMREWEKLVEDDV